MSMNRIILSDLMALGEDNRRDLGSADQALQRADMYRDDRLGAEARRDDMAKRSRSELALMPLVLSHIFAHRVARAAAGAAATVFVGFVMIAIANPLPFRVARWFVPGLLGVVLAVAMLAVHTVATWIAEVVFERRMRAAIATSPDVHEDLDRLAAGPVDVARQLIRRVDGWSLAGTLAGANAAIVMFGFLVFSLVVAREYPGAWTYAEAFAGATLARNVVPICLALVVGTALALLVGLACDRQLRRGTPPWLGVLAHRIAPIIANVVLLLVWFVGKRMAHTAHVLGTMPPLTVRLALAGAAVTAVGVLTTWAALWWRRREYARVGERPMDRPLDLA